MQPAADPIRDRAAETSTPSEQLALAEQAWQLQRAHLVGNQFVVDRCRMHGVDLDRVTSVRDLHRLPFTTKADLRRSQQEHAPFGAHLGVVASDVKLVYQTSGTTGLPCLVALTADDCETWWSIGMRSYRAAGISSASSVLVPFGAGPFTVGHSHGTVDRLGARRVPVSPGDSDRVVNAARAGLFDTLLCTPSFAGYLAERLAADEGLDARSFGIRRVITGGEPGGGVPAFRERIESVFGCRVVEVMGIGDVAPSLFAECDEQAGMHFCGQGFVWPELVDASTGEGVPIEAGARGELVYTALRRQAMPVVRFRSGDIVEITGTACGCGRTGFLMRVLGRTDDLFIVRGVNVYPSAVAGIVAEFQPAVTGRARVLLPVGAVAVDPPVPVEVEVLGDAAPTLAAEIEAALRSRLVFRAEIRFVPRDQFGEAAYKTALVVRR